LEQRLFKHSLQLADVSWPGVIAQPWPDVLDVWVARLASGMSGAATHGVIRTAHAVRALARRKTPERLGELARGLGYWASSYEELPVRKRTRRRLDTFAAVLDEVPLYRTALGKSPEGRNIVEGIDLNNWFPSFSPSLV
jgi:hypothetical protein